MVGNANVPCNTPDASGGFLAVSEKMYFPQDDAAVDLIFDKKNHKVGQFIKVRINNATSATLFGESVE